MASTDLAKLVVKLEAQTAQYDKSLKHANATLRKFRMDQNTALAKISAGFARLGSAALGAAAAFASFRTIVNSISAGDALAKFASKSGLGAEAASELAHAAKMADLDLDSLATGIKKMQVSLSQAGSGLKAPRDALAALGLSFAELNRLKPDEQFERIADQISKLQNPADRTRAAVELFGRAGADLLPLFEQGAAGIRAAREEAQRLGKSFSAEDLKRFADADDAFKRLRASGSSLADALVLKLSPALIGLANAARIALGGATDIEKLRFKINRMHAEGRTDEAAALERQQADMIRAAAGPEQLGKGKGRVSGAAPPPGFGGVVGDLDRLQPVLVTATKMMQDFNQMLRDTETDAQAAARAYEVFKIKLQSLLEAGLISSEEFNKRMQEFLDQAIPEVEITAKKMEVEKALDEMTVYAEQAARNIQDAFAQFLFDPFEDGVRGMLKSFIDAIRRMIAEMVAAKVLGGLAGVLGTIFKIPTGGKGGKPGGKAFGGPVSGGTPYMVGERGPELFVPGSSGNIIPSGRFGGIQQINNIDARGATVDLVRALPGILQENNRRLLEQSELRVVDGLRRNKYRLS